MCLDQWAPALAMAHGRFTTSNLGGTAIGTGIAADPHFSQVAVQAVGLWEDSTGWVSIAYILDTGGVQVYEYRSYTHMHMLHCHTMRWWVQTAETLWSLQLLNGLLQWLKDDNLFLQSFTSQARSWGLSLVSPWSWRTIWSKPPVVSAPLGRLKCFKSAKCSFW